MIILSACLAGVDCRYNGGHNLHPYCKKLMDEGKAVLVCPETLGGLHIPRPPAEIVGGNGDDVLAGQAFVKDKLGTDVTKAFIKGAQEVLLLAKKHGATVAVLKERSPSCGGTMIYNGTFSSIVKSGAGVTAALLKQNNIKVFSEENYPDF